MGHEIVIFGRIEAPLYRPDDVGLLWRSNEAVIAGLTPFDADEWPWLNRAMFALPGPSPQGTYRSQIIHFGASLKDDPYSDSVGPLWVDKFERLLRQLFWTSAVVVLEPEDQGRRAYEWLATMDAIADMFGEPPRPVTQWSRETVPFPDAI